MISYTPDFSQQELVPAPFYEEASAEEVPGKRTSKQPKRLLIEIVKEFERMGAFAVGLEPVRWQTQPMRFGYICHFKLNDNNGHTWDGQIPIIALPIQKFTPTRKERALATALYQFREWLQALADARRIIPGVNPLAPWLYHWLSEATFMEALADHYRIRDTQIAYMLEQAVPDMEKV